MIKNTPFPSFYALLPIIGVVLLILYASKETFVAKLLSLRFLVNLGLVSYSAYLWHQPLFAFARISLFEKPSNFLMITLSISSLILAFFSWKFVEQPFRNKHNFSRNKIFLYSIIFIFIFFVFGVTGILKNGYEDRFSAEQRKILDWKKISYKN